MCTLGISWYTDYNKTPNSENKPICAAANVSTGITSAQKIIRLANSSFTTGSGHPAMVSAPPVEKGETAVASPPKKIQV